MLGGERRGIFSLLVSLLASVVTMAEDLQNSPNVVDFLGKTIQKEVQAVKQPIDETIAYVGSSQCKHVKKLLGVSYEQLQGEKEPDLNGLELVYRSKLSTEIVNLKNAVELMLQRSVDNTQDFVLFAHGFIDDPSKDSFTNFSESYLGKGHTNVVALDGSSLIRWLYLRSSSYVRFIGESLGRVMAAMVQHGQKPERIHLVGHSLGSHIVGFAGKSFQEETGMKIGRITGLDPAGPCFSHVDPDLRLKASDAEFVDVIHTDSGVYGIKDTVGHADYFPNSGSLQPSCLLQTCSHSRAWLLYGASVKNPRLFPAVKCNDWEEFKKGRCSDEIRPMQQQIATATKNLFSYLFHIKYVSMETVVAVLHNSKGDTIFSLITKSYMGFGAKPTTGKFYLQTSGEYPYGLEEDGLKYKNRNGVVKNIQDSLFG